MVKNNKRMIPSMCCLLQIPSMFTGLITDCVPPYRPEVHDPGSKETSDSQTDTVRVHLCGQIECYDGKVTTVKLGRIR